MQIIKKIFKPISIVLVLCTAVTVFSISVYAADKPVVTEETTVTAVMTSEVVETAEIPVITTSEEITENPTANKPNPAPQTTKEDVPSSNTSTTEESKAPTITGNAVLIEEVSSDVVDRQFITIQSKNGNTFYLVIDRDSKGKENVYFMNLVDEYDMLAFAEDFPEGVTVDAPENDTSENTAEETEKNDSGQSDETTDSEKSSSGGNNMLLIAIGALVIIGGGAFFYFRVYKKPKKQKQTSYTYEEEDEEETVNEDTQSSDDE